MVAVTELVFKGIEHVEPYTFEKNRKTLSVREHYKIKVDEFDSNKNVNQQTLIAYNDNSNLINKLENLENYQKVKCVIELIYYRGTVNKIIILDVLNSEDEKESVSNIFKRL